MHGTGRPQCRWVFLVLVTAPKAAAKLALREPRCHFRYKTRPAHSKWPVLARFARAGRTLYRIRGGHEASRHNHTPSATGVEDAGGTGGHGLGAGGWRQGQGGYISDTVSQAPHERAQANKKPTSVIGCRPVVEVAR